MKKKLLIVCTASILSCIGRLEATDMTLLQQMNQAVKQSATAQKTVEVESEIKASGGITKVSDKTLEKIETTLGQEVGQGLRIIRDLGEIGNIPGMSADLLQRVGELFGPRMQKGFEILQELLAIPDDLYNGVADGNTSGSPIQAGFGTILNQFLKQADNAAQIYNAITAGGPQIAVALPSGAGTSGADDDLWGFYANITAIRANANAKIEDYLALISGIANNIATNTHDDLKEPLKSLIEEMKLRFPYNGVSAQNLKEIDPLSRVQSIANIDDANISSIDPKGFGVFFSPEMLRELRRTKAALKSNKVSKWIYYGLRLDSATPGSGFGTELEKFLDGRRTNDPSDISTAINNAHIAGVNPTAGANTDVGNAGNLWQYDTNIAELRNNDAATLNDYLSLILGIAEKMTTPTSTEADDLREPLRNVIREMKFRFPG